MTSDGAPANAHSRGVRCPRCVGLLYVDPVPDEQDAHDELVCINCGERRDPLIDVNRIRFPLPKPCQRETRQFPQLLTA